MCFHCKSGHAQNHIPTERRTIINPDTYRCTMCGSALIGSQTRGESPHWCNGRYIMIANSRPKIICLCGSTKFREAFRRENARLTLEGYIVLSVGCFRGDPEWRTSKIALDELHKRKIDLADEVYVVNESGYIGTSTRSEINYALSIGKPVSYKTCPGD